MKIYLAARYSRRLEICQYRDELVALGHVVTSRWLNGTHEFTEGLSPTAAYEYRQQFSQEDIEDIREADAIVSFTEDPELHGKAGGRGGRHVEFGFALGVNSATHKSRFRVIVVGHRENVFHCLPCVEFYANWEECKAAL